MAVTKQIWTLMIKNWRCTLLRHSTACILMAFIVPIALSAFFSYAKNLFVPPAVFGISGVHPVRSLDDAFAAAIGSRRDKVLLVNAGPSGGQIDAVLDRLESQIGSANDAMRAVRLDSEDDIAAQCPSSLRGVTNCYGAVIVRSSPEQGQATFWNYTIRSDAAFSSASSKIEVDSDSNPQQVYLIPLQHAVDSAIASLDDSTSGALDGVGELAYTSMTPKEREAEVRKLYQRSIVNFMGVVFVASVLWVTYHLTGFIASERESGMSQLVDAMMPVRYQWTGLAARIVAHHLSFSIVYAPAWIISSIIVRQGVFPHTSVAIVLFFVLLGGLAFTSMSILFASFFRRAQLSGITAILSCLLLAILAQSITQPDTVIVAVLSVLFTPCTFVYFVTFMARFERVGRPTDLAQDPPSSPWKLPGIFFWIMLVIHIFGYPLIGAVIEQYLYGTSTKGRQYRGGASADHGDNAVELRGFSKIYQPSFFSRLFATKSKPANPVVAVDNLSFDAGRGQIVALLGANGSGKSTTLDAIAGLHRLTDGTITIDGTGGLGIAPQKNVLWDDLTVEEHLHIFNRLKSPDARASRREIADLIEAVDLTKKRKALSKTLSGGQKRKLQLGMMLTGGSAVCCIDEVSSGIDPLSRRKLWDILLAERGRRTMILTTHFLDEADLLADHIAILSKGTLRAQGSSVELKDRLGGGYRVTVHRAPGLKAPDVEGVTRKETLDLVIYVSPSATLSARVIKELEDAGIADYRFSGPTIEDVFLQLAEEIRDEEAFRGAHQETYAKEKIRTSPDEDLDTASSEDGLKLMDGQLIGYFKQSSILFKKRLTVLKRNYLTYLIAFVLPVFAAGLTSLFVSGQDLPGCSPNDRNSKSSTEDAFTQSQETDDVISLFAGPAASLTNATLTRLFGPLFAGDGGDGGGGSGGDALSKIQMLDTYEDFTEFVESNREKATTGFWLGDGSSPATFAWVANLFVTSPILAQQFLDGVLTNTTIQTTWSAFAVPFNPSTGDSLNLVIYMALALACYPAFFALYPSHERRWSVRGLEYSNGVRPVPLWMAYLVFDFLFTLGTAALVTVVWVSLSSMWYHVEYVFVVLFLYGLASTVLAYFISLFTKTQLATYAWAAGIQVVGFLVYLIAYLCVITYVAVEDIESSLRVVHFVISAFVPIGSAMRALFVTTNLFSTTCDGQEISSDPSAMLQYGGPILFLILQSVILFLLVIWFDSGSVGSSVRGLFRKDRVPDSEGDVDEEVSKELTRLEETGSRENGLRVMHLTKTFKNNIAVDNVTFGIRRGEVYALLGPNGAGKSTTISLIRGDIKPSRNGGDVLVEEDSVTEDLAAARTNLGVCPQIDAVDHMTVREHLEFYARVRGIADVEHNVSAILNAVGLASFETRMAAALSGGNKRKLSLGIALMGNPTVVLLDEPSSGLDAASKRIMWKTLAALVPGRSILLTTHSMEEADALAHRAGIMARRMLAMGTPDELRRRFGDMLHIHLVHRDAPRTTDAEMDRVTRWIRESLPTADVETKTYHGQLRFQVSATDVLAATGSMARQEQQKRTAGDGVTGDAEAAANNRSAIGRLLILLEENRSALGIGHYSVSPTTLDEVFLSIVGRHNVQEEGYEDKKKSLWKRLFK
ncbi:ABC-type branched-chain amino acid transport system, ATPase component [Geosmithia morbida]|uniref:ABC-type branched-chain amino acid transport system, ATPase component n=1 Tax=Geosmithia morbida TaxID=1094350 RepID=A0A9P4YVY5_9HYPO|nr:ABC-type branched-chain amino acid transport system, ATPase component [Geosmithia morbida]KAF4122711.1 ABC-type branched-chain amino acid transport system, ATPase component [Geosmithia morbida]